MSTTQAFNAMAAAYGIASAAMYPDTVTFTRSTVTKGTAGGNLAASPSNTSPATIPCRYRPASGSERELAGKALSGVAYMIFVPAQYSSALIDVDAKCKAVIAARPGGESSRTMNVQTVERYEGIEIALLATLEA